MRTGLKEGRIRLAEFGQGVDKATAELLEGTGISTAQLQEWGQAVTAGGEQGQKAMVEVAKALSGIKDETVQNALGVKIFGKRKLCRNKTGQNRWKLSEAA